MRILLFLSTILVFASCEPSKPKRVTVNNLYSIEVDGLLSKANDLNDEASLQYQNIFSELYLIVLDESITEMDSALLSNGLSEEVDRGLHGYVEIVLDYFSLTVPPVGTAPLEELTINGMEAIRYKMYGSVEGIDVYYHFTFVKGKEHYYQILSWTLDENESKYKERMNRMAESFMEL